MVAIQELRKPQTTVSLERITYATEQTHTNWMKWINDPDIRKWMYRDMPQTSEEIYQWIHNAATDPRRNYFDIIVDGNTVGLVSLRQDQKPETTGEIGIVIGEKDYQGKGIGSQTIEQLLIYAKNKVKLTSVRAMIKPDNEKSIRLFTKQNFIETGRVTIDDTPMIRFEKNIL